MSFLVKKKNFYGQKGPSGYVPGVGRGATGFITRSDIGAARETGEVFLERNYYAQKRKTNDNEGQAVHDDDENEDLNDANYDEFSGYGGSLFTTGPYDKDDEEADQIYSSIDKRMDERRKDRREQKIQEQVESFRKKRPKIQQQFADLKRKLTTVTVEEWEAIPEVGDSRNKSLRNPLSDRFTPVPDSVIAQNMMNASNLSYLDPRQSSGMECLTSEEIWLEAIRLQPEDTAKHIISLAINSNPLSIKLWLKAGELEKGNITAQRRIYRKGLENISNSVRLWKAAVELEDPADARILLGRAVEC
ncbi:hypothetical protein MXB_3461, partial [Myxobolus squamalis]